MNKKSYIRMFAYMSLGAIGGASLAFFSDVFLSGKTTDIHNMIEKFFVVKVNYIQLTLFILLFIPTLVSYIKGSKLLKSLEKLSDDEVEGAEARGKRLIDISLTANMVYLFLNFVTIGIAFSDSKIIDIKVMLIALLLFVLAFIGITTIEIKSINLIKKTSSHIKGDPSRFNFHKEYINSCDEAEKFKIYKSAYKSFQFTKGVAVICLLISMLGNMFLNTGILPILLTAVILLSLILSYSADSMVKRI